MLGPCIKCHQEMRPMTMKIHEAPGTVGYGADGMCRTCRRRSGIKKTTPDCCVKCEKKMRPVGTKIKDYPGTSLHSGKGVCDSCDKRERRLMQGPKPKTVKVPEPEPEVIITPEVIEALGSFMQQRRARIAERERLDRAFQDAEAVRRRFIANRYGVAA